MIITLFAVSLIGGFLSGLLGIGGAVILIPLLQFVPPLFGYPPLTMLEITAISIVQVLVSSAAGCVAHQKSGNVHTGALLSIGIPMGICSLLGAFSSAYFNDLALRTFFGCLVVIAFGMLLLKNSDSEDKPVESEAAEAPEQAAAEEPDFEYKPVLFSVVGGGVGFAAGVVGAGGGFILIPLMIAVLNIPVRVTVGSSLGIVFIGALLGSVGKLMTGQVAMQYLLPVVIGCLPAAQVGAMTSKKLSVATLRNILIGLVGLTMVKTWIDLVMRFFG